MRDSESIISRTPNGGRCRGWVIVSFGPDVADSLSGEADG